MSVVLVTALGCRGGDALRSRGYTGSKYLQYRHIEFILEKDNEITRLRNIRARITLEDPEGYKGIRNEQLVYYMRPLKDLNQPICAQLACF